MKKEIYKIHVLDSSDNRIYYYSIKTHISTLDLATKTLLLEKGHDLGQSLYMSVKKYDIVDNSYQVLEV
jgi:hypothetical protein